MTTTDAKLDFGRVYWDHQILVYRAALGVTGHVEDAEDVVQTVFLHLLDQDIRDDRFRNLKGYLYNAAVKEAHALLRARLRRRIGGDLELVEERPADPRSRLDTDTLERLQDALAQLDPEKVALLNMRYQEGASMSDIAKRLGKFSFVVRRRVSRARAELRDLMAPPAVEMNHVRRGAAMKPAPEENNETA